MNGTTMSYQSAVILVATWIYEHGRVPTAAECRRSEGLPHRITLYYVCSGVSQAISAALALLYEQQWKPPSALPARPDVQCLRCGVRMPWSGPQVRQCESCRRIPCDAYNDWAYTAHGVDRDEDDEFFH